MQGHLCFPHPHLIHEPTQLPSHPRDCRAQRRSAESWVPGFMACPAVDLAGQGTSAPLTPPCSPANTPAHLPSSSFTDTFASKVAATQDQYADASIGNVTGSNAVNVFLGIGVAWSIAAIYHAANGEQFRVSPGTLAFSVTLFTIFAFINVGVLLYRRRPEIGGELGGPRTAKLLTSSLFVLLWLLYIFFSSLEAYCHIKGF